MKKLQAVSRWKLFLLLVVILSMVFAYLGSCLSNGEWKLSLPVHAVSPSPISYTITVSATIGEPKLTLFGYTSPQALVELKGFRVAEAAVANAEGYFFFDRVFLPRPIPAYPELCLTAIDTASRISFPTCLPPLPTGPYEITVGPVLLPPTLSLSKGNFPPGEQVVAQGETIPGAEVTIFLANHSPRRAPPWLGLDPIRVAYAYSLPQYQIKTDKNGHFEFNLPSFRPAQWRVFAGASFLHAPTPKSNTLTFKILAWWEWFWLRIKEIFLFLLGRLKPYWWLIVILVEIAIIFTLVFRRSKARRKNSSPLADPGRQPFSSEA